MRVIAGAARGRKLFAPIGADIRPTTDRMKENLFNVLAEDVQGSRFLDIFSGTGAIGIEALSRGAESAVFVDKASAPLIEKNLSATGLSKRGMILNSDYAAALHKLSEKHMEFEIIFMDPPYHKGLVPLAAGLAGQLRLLAPNGLLVAEAAPGEVLPPLNGMAIYKVKRYGTSVFFFYSGA